jgi:hypothetical protein
MIDGLLERAVKMGQTSFSNDELPVHEDEDMVE